MTSTTLAESDPAPRPKRRSFSPEYKLRIVAEYEAAPKNEKGARSCAASACTTRTSKEWRAARDAGALEKLVDKRASPARPKKSDAEVENEKLRRQVERSAPAGAAERHSIWARGGFGTGRVNRARSARPRPSRILSRSWADCCVVCWSSIRSRIGRVPCGQRTPSGGDHGHRSQEEHGCG